MAKFTLIPNPTFKQDVSIPVPGQEDGVLNITFKHLPLSELTRIEANKERPVYELLMDIMDGWNLPDEFTAENVKVLVDNYSSAARRILEAYYRELLHQREKN